MMSQPCQNKYGFFCPPLPGTPAATALPARRANVPQQPGTALFDHYLDAGYSCPPPLVGEAISYLMKDVPPGPPFQTSRGDLPSDQGTLTGAVRFDRMRLLHRLLCSSLHQHERDVVTVENGSGRLCHLSAVVALLGSSVHVKEPSRLTGDHHQETVAEHAPHLVSSQRIQHVSKHDIDAPLSVDIVYWPNPNYIMFPAEQSLLQYLGRDVRPGGWLVIQTDGDHESLALGRRMLGPPNPRSPLSQDHRIDIRTLTFPADSWLTVYAGELPDSNESNYLLPTFLDCEPQWLQVYWRRPI